MNLKINENLKKDTLKKSFFISFILHLIVINIFFYFLYNDDKIKLGNKGNGKEFSFEVSLNDIKSEKEKKEEKQINEKLNEEEDSINDLNIKEKITEDNKETNENSGGNQLTGDEFLYYKICNIYNVENLNQVIIECNQRKGEFAPLEMFCNNIIDFDLIKESCNYLNKKINPDFNNSIKIEENISFIKIKK